MSDNLLTWLDDLIPNDKALRIRVVAEKLDMSPSAIYNMLNKGLLPGVKIGKSWRIFPSDLKQYLMKHNNDAIQEGKQL